MRVGTLNSGATVLSLKSVEFPLRVLDLLLPHQLCVVHQNEAINRQTGGCSDADAVLSVTLSVYQLSFPH